jgi:hypothetical protein
MSKSFGLLSCERGVATRSQFHAKEQSQVTASVKAMSPLRPGAALLPPQMARLDGKSVDYTSVPLLVAGTGQLDAAVPETQRSKKSSGRLLTHAVAPRTSHIRITRVHSG